MLSLFAELYANSRPLLVFYQGAYYFPLWRTYPETTFGGDFATEADYHDPFIRDKLTSGGNWAIYPPIRWDYKALNLDPALHHPSPPSAVNWLGTDDRGRDVFARLLYGFRVSIFFGLILACLGTVLGILIGAMQGFFGGWLDLLGQRGIENLGFSPRTLSPDYSLSHLRAQHPLAHCPPQHLWLDGPECLRACRIPARPQLRLRQGSARYGRQ